VEAIPAVAAGARALPLAAVGVGDLAEIHSFLGQLERVHSVSPFREARGALKKPSLKIFSAFLFFSFFLSI
jgi:hypothetical protein